tara:strand:+ start:146 stop:439 length:294 start_codon:yes stop_codon:yes gene_type:complete
MKNKEIKTILESQKVKFNIKGHTEYAKRNDGSWGHIPKLFKTNKFDDKPVGSISDKHGISGMNIDKFGPSSFTVYTFDLLGKKTRGRIKYQDVTLIL